MDEVVVTGEQQGAADSSILLELDAGPTIGYASIQNSVPVVRAVRVTNRSEEDLADLELLIRCDPGFAQGGPDVDLVIHSSWRQIYPSLEWLRPELPEDMAARVVAITDVNIYSRLESIEAYLRAHPEVKAYVVLDDNDSFPAHVPLVLCNPEVGMSDPAKAEELRKALEAAKKRARY